MPQVSSGAQFMHESESSRTPRGLAAPLVQEADSTRTPRDGETAAPTSLLKVLQMMKEEKVIVPSKHFMRMIKDEERTMRLRNASDDETFGFMAASSSTGDAFATTSVPKAPLATQLVEQILEYCRWKLLEKDVEPEEASLPFAEEEREERLAQLLRRCTETYGQLLLAHSDVNPPASARQAKPCTGSLMSAASNQASARSLDTEAGRSPVLSRKGTDPIMARGRARTTTGDESSDRLAAASQSHSPGRVPKPHPPTPFYETLYALVARAVQQGMRASAEGSGLGQEKGGLAQLAARVEDELGRLFRSDEFGRSSGRALRKGGSKVDAGGGSEGVESAQLAARAEAELGKLIKSASQLATKLDYEFRQLETRLKRNNQEEAKQSDQADKTPAGGPDSKEAVVDHAASHGSVDALIAGFWQRAVPKQRRAEQTLMMQHVVTTRSPMINSLLPSPHTQAMSVKDAARRSGSRRRLDTFRAASQRAQLNGGHIMNTMKPASVHHSELAVDADTVPAFRNTWALSQERVIHTITKSHPAPSLLWFASSTSSAG